MFSPSVELLALAYSWHDRISTAFEMILSPNGLTSEDDHAAGPTPRRAGGARGGSGGGQAAVRDRGLREDDVAGDSSGRPRRRVDGAVPVRLQGGAVP